MSGRRTAAGRRQLRLSLGGGEVPESLLRSAYERCPIKLSFDEAMKEPMFHKCIRNVAIASVLKGGRR